MSNDLITEARELHTGWMAYESMCHGGGQGAKSDDGEASRKFMLWLADEFPALCDALEKAAKKNEELMRELSELARESVERDCALAKLEAEVEDALREQAEREKGCEACGLIYKLDGAAYGTVDELIDNKFCPMCGKMVEDKP